MKTKFLFAVILFFISTIGKSQNDFRNAYYINSNNDTIHGLINFKGHYATYKTIKFKKEINSAIIELTINDAKSVRFKNEGYLVQFSLPEESSEILFVEQLIEGIVDIFCFKKDREINYYIRKEDGDLIKLKNSKLSVNENGKTYIKRGMEYAGILSLLFNDSPSSVKKIPFTTLSPNSLVDISKFYHDDVCDDYECMVYSKKKVKFNFDIGITAGYAVSSILLEKNKFVKGLNADFSNSQDPVIGVFINISEESLAKNLSLQIEGNFQQVEHLTDTSSISFNYLKTPLIIKYTFPIKKIEPSIQVGFSRNSWFSFKDKGIVPKVQEKPAIQDKKVQRGVLLGVDFSIDLTKNTDLFIQGRFENIFGDHYNKWKAWKFGEETEVQDHVKSKSKIFSISGGIKF